MDPTRACINIQKTCPKIKEGNLFVLPLTTAIDLNWFTISRYDLYQVNKFYVGHDENATCNDPFTSQNSSTIKMIGQMSCFKFIPSQDKTFYYLQIFRNNWVFVKYTDNGWELKQECNGGSINPHDKKYKWSITKGPGNLYSILNQGINYYIDPLSPNCLSETLAYVELNSCLDQPKE